MSNSGILNSQFSIIFYTIIIIHLLLRDENEILVRLSIGYWLFLHVTTMYFFIWWNLYLGLFQSKLNCSQLDLSSNCNLLNYVDILHVPWPLRNYKFHTSISLASSTLPSLGTDDACFLALLRRRRNMRVGLAPWILFPSMADRFCSTQPSSADLFGWIRFLKRFLPIPPRKCSSVSESTSFSAQSLPSLWIKKIMKSHTRRIKICKNYYFMTINLCQNK